jgi:polysaccharide biosynthesis/export protein
MTNKLSLLILLLCPICLAQSVPSTPLDSSVPDLDWPTTTTPKRAYDRNQPRASELSPYVDPYATSLTAPPWTNQGQERNSTRILGPLTTKSEFQSFAEDAAGHPLQVYGRQLFDEVPTTFAPIDRVPVPANYSIGPGDELLIRVWGKVELQSRVLVDRNGQIFIPKVGALSVAGLRYEQLEGYIHAAIGNLYKDFDLNVTLGQLRSIQIFVLGSARQPGVYTVSSLSTLVNALFASGGPSATGTMRHIQLRRANQVVGELDIYDLLRNGDKSHDVQLLPGDVIYIPPAGPQTAVLGSVNEPGIYELKDDTTIASILKDVAGLTSLASVDRALLEKVENHRRRQVDEFALDPAGLQRQIRDGDILRILPISPRFENSVTLRGNVAQPGRYLWHEGMRVSDLIPTRDSLLTRDYWNQQNFLASTLPPWPSNSPDAFRSGADPGERNYPNLRNYPNQQNFPSQRNYANQQNYLNPQMHVGGASYQNGTGEQSIGPEANPVQIHDHWDQPKAPSDTPTRDVMTDVTEAGTEINWEYAAIERRDDNDLTTRIIPFNLGNAIDKPATPDNQPLKIGDVITIFSRKDVPLPQDKQAAFVRIGGEVNAPGVYRVNPGETLRELVARAGGLTAHSYLYASLLTRVSTRLAQEKELQLSAAQMQRDLASRYASASATLSPTNATEQQAQFSAQQALIAQLFAVHPVGRIVLDMKPDSATVDDVPDFPLENGDSYYVPAKMGTIQVSGAVYNENAFRYQQAKLLSSYLKSAGGPTRQADTKRMFLIRADGTVVSRQNQTGPWGDSFASLTVLPGDSIVVPTKLKSPNSFSQQIPFLVQIMSQAATTAAVIATH